MPHETSVLAATTKRSLSPAGRPTFAMDQASGSLSQAGHRTGDPPSCLAGLSEERSPVPKLTPVKPESGFMLCSPTQQGANQISRIKSRCTKLVLSQLSLL